MLFVSATLEHWLEKAPRGVLPFGGDGATEAIEALAKSWASTVLHRLATRPHSLAELVRAVDATDAVSLERCLEAMRRAGQVESRPSGGEGAAFAVTDWLRRGVGPLTAAARLERRHFKGDTPPVEPLDVEAALLLSAPLLRLQGGLSGSCRMVVELDDGKGALPAGATVRVEEGRVASCTSRLLSDTDAWAAGDLGGWFEAVIARAVSTAWR